MIYRAFVTLLGWRGGGGPKERTRLHWCISCHDLVSYAIDPSPFYIVLESWFAHGHLSKKSVFVSILMTAFVLKVIDIYTYE